VSGSLLPTTRSNGVKHLNSALLMSFIHRKHISQTHYLDSLLGGVPGTSPHPKTHAMREVLCRASNGYNVIVMSLNVQILSFRSESLTVSNDVSAWRHSPSCIEASRDDEAGRRFDRPEDGLTLTK
jgi:hypothetical protein